MHGWTTRSATGHRDELGGIQPRGGTALYDAVAEAIPLVATGQHRKKALLIISDGNDTSSHTAISALKRKIRETEVLVYAIGIDAMTDTTRSRTRRPMVLDRDHVRDDPVQAAAPAAPFPFPMPRGHARPGQRPRDPRRPTNDPRGPATAAIPAVADRGTDRRARPRDEPVNVAALRDITDDSGGRTEVIRAGRAISIAATAGIADEL